MANKYLDGAGDPILAVNGTPADEDVPQYDTGDARTDWAAGGGGGGGGLVFLQRLEASSSSSLDFTGISSTYDNYVLVGDSIRLATNAAHLYLEAGTGAGPTYDTGNNYEWSSRGHNFSGTELNNQNNTGIFRLIANMANGTATWAGNFNITALGLNSTTVSKAFVGTGYHVDTTGPNHAFMRIGGIYKPATAVTALRFIASSGNIASGSITVYGLAKS